MATTSAAPRQAAFAVAAAFGDLLVQAGDTIVLSEDEVMSRADAG
jgi:hypothetical protein